MRQLKTNGELLSVRFGGKLLRCDERVVEEFEGRHAEEIRKAAAEPKPPRLQHLDLNQLCPLRGPRKKPDLSQMRTSYIVEITSWDWAYWLSINAGDVTSGPMMETRHLLSAGVSRSPSVPPANVVEIALLPKADMDHFHVPKGTLERMGGIFLNGDVLKVIQSIFRMPFLPS